MASMSLLRVLCLRHEQAESEEVVMWLLGRQERAVYGEMMLEVQVGAGCFLIVAAWIRRLDAFPISDLLLLQILDAEKVSLQPLIPELVAALVVSAKGDQLTCEWLYLLSLLSILSYFETGGYEH